MPLIKPSKPVAKQVEVRAALEFIREIRERLEIVEAAIRRLARSRQGERGK
ncbi:MAG: hypothetical protein ACYDCL_10920 [Myxococcales bacterium]